MKSVASVNSELPEVASAASELEAQGAEVIAAAELTHDPMLLLAMAATGTSAAQLMSSISVAFARSPMTLALQAHDLNCLSQGRFILGLGSQIKPHIEKRYSMPWSKPAARMREYVLALKAIWAAWNEGAPLNCQGDFYTHTLMTPMFTPRDTRFGAPPVYVAAVGPVMSANAAEVADGILLHSFVTEEYIREVMLPAVDSGLAKSGRSRQDIKLVGSPFLVTGETREEFDRVKQAVCGQIAFYGSTPAYKGVLDSVGYGELQPELLRLSRQGKWAEMGLLIDDGLLNRIGLVGEPQQIAVQLCQRYGDLFDCCGASVMGGEAYSELNYCKAVGDAVKSI